MQTTNNPMNNLIKQRHNLIRLFDSKNIEEELYNQQMQEVTRQINDEQKVLMNELKNKIIEQNNTIKEEKLLIEKKNKKGVKIMGKEIKVDEPKKKGKQPDKNSYTMLIIKALSMKSIKTIDTAVAKVEELRPGRDKTKIATQMKTIINLVKKQKEDRWKKYDWDEEKFLLILKE